MAVIDVTDTVTLKKIQGRESEGILPLSVVFPNAPKDFGDDKIMFF